MYHYKPNLEAFVPMLFRTKAFVSILFRTSCRAFSAVMRSE